MNRLEAILLGGTTGHFWWAQSKDSPRYKDWWRMTKINRRLLSGASLAALVLGGPSAARTTEARIEVADPLLSLLSTNTRGIEAHAAANINGGFFGDRMTDEITLEDKTIEELAAQNIFSSANERRLSAQGQTPNDHLLAADTELFDILKSRLPVAGVANVSSIAAQFATR